MHKATALITALIAAAALAGCSEPSQGRAERKPTTPASADCGQDSTLSEAEWLEKCAGGDSPPAEQPDTEQPTITEPSTELAVGDSFVYDDGVTVNVQHIRKLTQFGEFDTPPAPNQTGYRVTLTVHNNGATAVDLDTWFVSEVGATSGGEVEMLLVEKGSRPLTGRIAPGKKGTFTSEGALDKSYGTEIVVTVTRGDIGMDMLAEDPNWTGPIT